MKSPLRYPGGKAKLSAFFRDLIETNSLKGIDYAEPFAGGSGLALSLLSTGHVGHIHLNDIDEFIAAFWKCVLENTQEFADKIISTEPTMDEWRRQKEILSQPDGRPILELGFCAFFLNRTNRSGIIEGAGVIGGYAQSGRYNVTSRYYAETMAKRVLAIGERRDDITFTHLDALEFCRKHRRRENVLLYLDPPYFGKGSRLYKSFYEHEDHKRLRDLVSTELSKNWVVSYDSAPAILDLYKGHSQLQYGLPYTAARRRSGTEAIFFSPELKVPPLRKPMTLIA